MTNFVSLHNQTSFSVLDSLIDTKELFKKAKELGQPAIAITDHGSLAATWDALKASKSTGVKFIVGCEFYFVNQAKDNQDKFRHVILLAKNAVGYRNLLTLNKRGFDQGAFLGKRVYSLIDWYLLKIHAEGLICLTACGNGIISQLLMNKKFDEATSTLLRLKEIFGENLALEVQPNNMKRNANFYTDEIDQQFLNRRLIDMGKKHEIKVVPACNAHYLNKEDGETHDVLLAIGSRQPVHSNFRLKYPVNDFYLKSGDEVVSFFARNYGEEYAKEMVQNTIHFADMCEFPDWIDPKYSNPSGKELPVFPVSEEPDYQEYLVWLLKQPENIQKMDSDKNFLRFRCDKFFHDRIKNLNESNEKIYRDRLEEELDVMEFHGFSSYMLIVADFIDWARRHGIAIGHGRGSVGGSLIGYLTNVHQADPITYDLVFARFHNKEKSSFPDIDVDIAPAGREAVQDYIKSKYGTDHVAHVSNVNTITPKVYVRDIARACELGGSKEDAVRIGNEVADCIAKEVRNIDEAMEKFPVFAEYCKRYPQFLKYKAICGKHRAWSTHAGGIIISARPLVGLVPLRRDKDGSWAVEYDKDKSEENGLVKMDTLGLSTLDILGTTYKIIKNSNKEVPVINYEEHDPKAYELLSRGDTFCVFQLGASGAVDLCKRVKPSNINDIANINALVRPSAKDMRDAFIKVRNGKMPMSLLHPNLGRAFNDTYGFGLYEECLMYLAQDIAGWTLHSADRLRKLTKEKGKDPKKAAAWRTEFIQDAVKQGVPETIGQRIWDEVVGNFAGYGFNKCLHFMEEVETYSAQGIPLGRKSLRDIRPGVYVRSRNEFSRKDHLVQVLHKHDNGIQSLIRVEMENGLVVQCTPTHKFRVFENSQMLPMSDIIRNDYKIVLENKPNGVKIRAIIHIGNFPTFDLEVDHDDHQFYLANGMLTSNSHAILYSMNSYETAYLKANYPVEFLLANLMEEVNSNTPDAKVNIENIKKEIRDQKVKILPPDINTSKLSYTLEGENKLLTGLDALKFVGEDAIKDIIQKRPFKDFFDFMVRVDSSAVRANSIQALAAAGALSSFKIPRKLIFLYCSDYRKKLQVWLKKHDPNTERFEYPFPEEKDWNLPEIYALENYYLGESFTCTKYEDAYGRFFKENHYTVKDIPKPKKEDRGKIKLSPVRGVLKKFFEFSIKKEGSKYLGRKMAKAIIEDKHGHQCGLTIFPDGLDELNNHIARANKGGKGITLDVGLAIAFASSVNVYEDEVGLILDSVQDIAPTPPLPTDLKAKKVNLKTAKKSNDTSTKSLEEELVDDLYDEGLIDLDEESDD